jgi:hypothetical protein
MLAGLKSGVIEYCFSSTQIFPIFGIRSGTAMKRRKAQERFEHVAGVLVSPGSSYWDGPDGHGFGAGAL